MNRKFTYFGLASVLLISVAPAYSQAPPAPAPKDASAAEAKLPTVDELSDKCAKGSGGKDAWAKLKTMSMTGTIDVPTFGVSGTVEVLPSAQIRSFASVPLQTANMSKRKASTARRAGLPTRKRA
jgi:hypothetical protein